jgi:hypothetical protein
MLGVNASFPTAGIANPRAAGWTRALISRVNYVPGRGSKSQKPSSKNSPRTGITHEAPTSTRNDHSSQKITTRKFSSKRGPDTSIPKAGRNLLKVPLPHIHIDATRQYLKAVQHNAPSARTKKAVGTAINLLDLAVQAQRKPVPRSRKNEDSGKSDDDTQAVHVEEAMEANVDSSLHVREMHHEKCQHSESAEGAVPTMPIETLEPLDPDEEDPSTTITEDSSSAAAQDYTPDEPIRSGSSDSTAAIVHSFPDHDILYKQLNFDTPKGSEKPKYRTPIHVYESYTDDPLGYAFIGGFISPLRAARCLGLTPRAFFSIMKGSQIYKDKYRFTSAGEVPGAKKQAGITIKGDIVDVDTIQSTLGQTEADVLFTRIANTRPLSRRSARFYEKDPVYVYQAFPSGWDFVGGFASMYRAAQFLNTDPQTVAQYVKSGKPYNERYSFTGPGRKPKSLHNVLRNRTSNHLRRQHASDMARM